MNAIQLSLFEAVNSQQLLSLKPSKAEIIVAVAKRLARLIEKGKRIGNLEISQLMTEAAGGSDAQGLWHWQEAYSSLECGLVLYLRSIAPLIIKTESSAALDWLYQIQASLPTHSRRSTTQNQMQQFSTPLALSYIASRAAAIEDGDLLLEPSAGTGMLAIWGEIGKAKLVLNELDQLRLEILQLLFARAKISQFNAEQIHDYLSKEIAPTVVLLNPPFSASPNCEKRNPFATYKHINSALSRLSPGGRLVAITADWFSPTDAKWRKYLEEISKKASLLLSAGIAGKEYQKHGVNIQTRLTVIDKTTKPGLSQVISECLTIREILSVIEQLPAREAITPTATERVSERKSSLMRQSVALSDLPSSNSTLETIRIKYAPIIADRTSVTEEGIYQAYTPQTIAIEGASTHPTPLVQSIAMASVMPPMPTYQPLLPKKVIEEKILSQAQLEAIIYAGNAHQDYLEGWYVLDEKLAKVTSLPNPSPGAVRWRKGYFIGDGTGVGKGRECAGILLDNWLQGKKKGLWLSKSDKLIEDARRDWQALGGDAQQIIPVSKYAQNARIEKAEGIIFVTYATLRTQAIAGKQSRVEQLLSWLGKDFDGAIVFDECHALANAISSPGERGVVKSSKQGEAGLKLQRALPDAKIVYVSATGATKLNNLSYAERLGLWGIGTQFVERESFISSIGAGGIAALEVVARDLKALGVYISRSLSYQGVEYEILCHELTQPQIEIYNSYAEAYEIIHSHIQDALKETNVISLDGKNRNSVARSAAYSTFESTKQRFFNHLLLSMKCPSLIKAIERDLDLGYAAVIQLVSTGEALLERRLADIPTSDWGDLRVDITPREYVFDYLINAFPIHLYEVRTDEEGVEIASLAQDENGNPIVCQAAIEQRNQLLENLALLPPVPSALDQILHYFGHELVAECTGRTKRVIRQVDSRSDKLLVQKLSANANLAETNAFTWDRKRILIFSQAGGTGRSYHADLNAENQRLRRHYLLELGWSASEAIQGLGRTHRSHQKQPPTFILTTTNVKAERRFTSTIAKRLDSLGALSKGQRQTGGQGLFAERDNLESEYALAALRDFYDLLCEGRLAGLNLARFEQVTGLKLTNSQGYLREDLPPMNKFLNRCLAMPIAYGDEVFARLEELIETRIEAAIQAGIYEIGVETIGAEKFEILERWEIYKHSNGSVSEAVKIQQHKKSKKITVREVLHTASSLGGQLCINPQSGNAALVHETTSLVGRKGEIVPRVNLVRPSGNKKMTVAEFERSSWHIVSTHQFIAAWERELDRIPDLVVSTFYLIVGLLLPIWHKLDSTKMKVYRVCLDKQTLLGRVIGEEAICKIAANFGITKQLTALEIYQNVKNKKLPQSLTNKLSLRYSFVAGRYRLEVTGFESKSEIALLKNLGLFTEIHNYQLRAFIPDLEERAIEIIERLKQLR